MTENDKLNQLHKRMNEMSNACYIKYLKQHDLKKADTTKYDIRSKVDKLKLLHK